MMMIMAGTRREGKKKKRGKMRNAVAGKDQKEPPRESCVRLNTSISFKDFKGVETVWITVLLWQKSIRLRYKSIICTLEPRELEFFD